MILLVNFATRNRKHSSKRIKFHGPSLRLETIRYVLIFCLLSIRFYHTSSIGAVQPDRVVRHGDHHQSAMVRAGSSERRHRRLSGGVHQPERNAHPDEDETERARSDHQLRTVQSE